MKIASLLVLLAACEGESAPPTADTRACARLQGGPFQNTTIGTIRDSSAPEVDDDGIVYRLTMSAAGGFVFFGVDVPGDYGIFLNQDLTVEITDPDAAVVAPIEDTTSSVVCSEVAHRIVAPMVVGTHFLEIGAGATTGIDLVVEPVALDRDE